MARFKPVSEVQATPVNEQLKQEAATSAKNYPFKNLYGCAEGEFVYVNMEAVEGLTSGMKTLRDIALIVDISGSMNAHYKNGSVTTLIKQIVDTVGAYDDDGIDLMFFAKGLVYSCSVGSESQVDQEVQNALSAKGAYGTTMPTPAFEEFCKQLKSKGRAGTVLFLTDGAMDDMGASLKAFYQNVLHTQFKTRDNFYCYAVEFGSSAFGALDVLDGLYAPEQGPEDLFDLESADRLDKITEVLTQVCGMSAVGSDVEVKASTSDGVKIDMVNADLIEGGMEVIEGAINKVMSFRMLSEKPFTLTVAIKGYDPMTIEVIPSGIDVELKIK